MRNSRNTKQNVNLGKNLFNSQILRNAVGNFEVPLVFILCLAISLSGWMGDFEGGDIAAARKSYLGASPIDIWGGFSGLFYGNIPRLYFSWGLYLLVLQMACSTVGLILVRRFFLSRAPQYSRGIFLISSYLILNFSSFLTRDSTILSFLLAGLGLWLKGLCGIRSLTSKAFVLAGAVFIFIGCSFRPWISIAVAFLVFAISKNLHLKFSRIQSVGIFLAIAITPIAFDTLAYLGSDLRKVHPELQVIAMDAASFACYSNNRDTRDKGVATLEAINGDNLSNDEICGNYQPNTWQSVAFWELNEKDARGLGLERYTDKNLQNLIEIPTDLNPSVYSNVRKLWIKTILSDPKNYLQIKISQFVQVAIAGDSAGLRVSVLRDHSVVERILKGIVLTPYDIFESLHLISPIIIILVGMIYLVFKSRMLLVRVAIRRLDVLYLFLFPIIWGVATTVAFIGDNGRYMYPATLLFAFLLNGFVFKGRVIKK